MVQPRPDFKLCLQECVDRYGDVLHHAKSLAAASAATEDGSKEEAQVSETEALCVRGALLLGLGEILQAHSSLKRGYNRLQVLYRDLREGGEKTVVSHTAGKASQTMRGAAQVRLK